MKIRRAIGIVALVVSAMSLAWVDAAEIPKDQRRSGATFMAPETRAMQNDDTANPGMLAVLDGETPWKRKAGTASRACADCHGEAAASMRGVAARYPAYDDKSDRPVDIEQRINMCRVRHQQATPFADESRELNALAILVGRQSRGMPIEAGVDPRLAPFVANGKALFERRQGQLNLACANCHDDNWDRRLAGAAITQAHPTGYPIYRLEWQGTGSLKRRLRSCMIGTRAQPYQADDPEMVELELYLMSRAKGMPIETPAVRP